MVTTRSRAQPPTSRDGAAASGLAGAGGPGRQNVQTAVDRGIEEVRRLRGEGAESDQTPEVVRLGDELANVDGPVLLGDAGDHDVELA